MKFFGLIGGKLSHSMSPFIHRNIGKMRDIDMNYQLFEVKKENVETAIRGLAALGAGGVNVTIPYKVDVMAFATSISPEAIRIGSANTLCFHEKGISAFNTDYYGFAKSLKRYNAPVKNARALVLGNGGASRSVCLALHDFGAKEVFVASRDSSITEFLVGDTSFPVIGYNDEEMKGPWDILVNTTPVGMSPDMHNCPVPKEVIESCRFVYDLIYNPLRTNLLEYAERAGIKCCNGLYMLVSQAAEAQKIWNCIELTEFEIDEICINLIRET